MREIHFVTLTKTVEDPDRRQELLMEALTSGPHVNFLNTIRVMASLRKPVVKHLFKESAKASYPLIRPEKEGQKSV